MKKLALFDFDGTLTTKDSLNEFLKYSVGIKRYILNLILFSPIFLSYKLKIIPNDKAKQILIGLFFKGWNESKFKQIAKNFSLNKVNLILNQKMYNKLLKLQKTHRVIIVSASIECWLKPWCDRHNIELLATKLKFKEGKFSGYFSTKNCYGKEKINRINEYINLLEYKEIVAFGDSEGDKEMFEISTIY